MSSIELSKAELKRVSSKIDVALEQSLLEFTEGPAAHLYEMLRYFMGYLDENLNPVRVVAGKRFRSGLALMFAEAYGSYDQTFDAALAIELFHNFSLIHDDVEDRDEMRRGRPTVWKLWGVNHAINSGDTQLILVNRWCLRAARHPVVGEGLAEALMCAFQAVTEGQYLDFELTEASLQSELVSEDSYMTMIERKSAVLVGVSAEVAGIAAGKDDVELSRLREFGRSLGLAYQIADDYASVWGLIQKTGKDVHGDIREHKRTLPFLHARTVLEGEKYDRLLELYSIERQLSESEVNEAFALIDVPEIREFVSARIRQYVEQAKEAIRHLSIPEEKREFFEELVDYIVPALQS